ncbi:alpha/beta hydrolase [Streptomyces sp. S.PB5]|uniref:alpha/beta fold hydrolase n=1 Tax=Streptomyces sp. S.PB5 TaxID=3020844 RepID=UPI0025AFC5BF|nr:alpha/beta hydrolase [Streptomyces sp. S.PB5]MDN3022575.1 alpha/beta hydrolase [Streptomyces sp. S.PB5]
MRHIATPDGTRLAYRDHPRPHSNPASRTAVLLHGLAGHMGEWDALTPHLLASGFRVVTYDARAHGASTRRPPTVTRAAYVDDAAALIEGLGLGAVTLVGQSLGGHTAMLLASRRPELVAGLVLVEAGPAGPSPEVPGQIAGWLESWPTPFGSVAEAERFLGHEAWARGLEQRADGWYPRFDPDRMVESLAELAENAYWQEWSRITCPTLVVQGGNGTMRPTEAADMRALRPDVRVTVVPGAGHDVHLEQPEQLAVAMDEFVRLLDRECETNGR